MNRIIFLSLIGAAALVLNGCGSKVDGVLERPDPSGQAPTDASGAALVFDMQKMGIEALKSHTNPIVSANAKKLEQHLQAYDYTEAAVNLSTIASLRMAPNEMGLVRNAMNEFNRVAVAAAGSGDENAQYALEYLKELRN